MASPLAAKGSYSVSRSALSSVFCPTSFSQIGNIGIDNNCILQSLNVIIATILFKNFQSEANLSLEVCSDNSTPDSLNGKDLNSSEILSNSIDINERQNTFDSIDGSLNHLIDLENGILSLFQESLLKCK